MKQQGERNLKEIKEEELLCYEKQIYFFGVFCEF